jgi:hypothetical protein
MTAAPQIAPKTIAAAAGFYWARGRFDLKLVTAQLSVSARQMHEVIHRRDAENSEKEEARSRQEGGEKGTNFSANLCVLCASAVKVFFGGAE